MNIILILVVASAISLGAYAFGVAPSMMCHYYPGCVV